ncbi:hypothetical protein ACQPUY_07285 [Clostridium nigeriense]|uniref:hypothetical protein n=1 Tax=Clostridium nigeriense TaxID=1805470 RepID=UPI003D34BFF8
MLIALIFFAILFVWFVCVVLQHDMENIKLIFISIFTILISIGINIFVINVDTTIGFIFRSISFLFLTYGIISGIQYLIRR